MKVTLTQAELKELEHIEILIINDEKYVRRDRVIEMLGKFATEQKAPLEKTAEQMASALEKLLNGLAKDGVALDGFTDAWNALIKYKEMKVEKAIDQYDSR